MNRIPSVLLISLMVHSAIAHAQWRSLAGVDSVQRSGDNSVLVYSSGAAVRIDVVRPGVIRVRLAPFGVFAPDYSEAVVTSAQGDVPVTVETHPDRIALKTAEATVEIDRQPLRIRLLDARGEFMTGDDQERGMAWSGAAVRVWKTMPPDESYYGFGEKAGKLEKRATHLTMWNTDIPAYTADTDPLYQSIPFFLAIRQGRAYGILLNNTYWSSFDMGKESRSAYSFGAEGGQLDYYVFIGPEPKTVIERYTGLVGRMPLPPLWSLGYQQCRWSYYPDERVRELARTFRDKKIPADVIYLDIDYMEGYRIFSWSKKNFPHPEALIRDLGSEGFKIAVILDPGIKQDTTYATYRSGLAGGHFLTYPDGSLYIGKVWPGLCAFPDFSNPQTRQWWGEELQPLVSLGVRGFWTDMNEPSVFDVPTKTVDLSVTHFDHGLRTSHAKNHNTYGLLMTQATREGVLRHRPGERPFVLTRASSAGGQRYSAAWTGDNVASWEHLQMTIPMCLNLGLSGQPFVGSDIGGFVRHPEGELYVRWLQLGIFTPLMRTHTETGTPSQEPWSFGEEFERINRSSIELRYKLLPYLYTTMRQASETGIPAMRPMVLEHPNSQEARSMGDQFYIGDHLLVAPVLRPAERTRTVWLPEGRWYDFWDGTVSSGPGWITVSAPLEKIPLFIRAGGVIPMQPVMQFVGEKPTDPLTLLVFPTDSGTGEIYEDDGLSFDYQKGAYVLRTLSQRVRPDTVSLDYSPPAGAYRPGRKSLVVQVVGLEWTPSEVTLVSDTDDAGPQRPEWTIEEQTKSITIKLSESAKPWKLVLTR